ncbi:MAG: tandem-95 repeat protein, partial [Opitutae bacterium]|nr:tandem-95 repeat protein [Opitutae bacterium]
KNGKLLSELSDKDDGFAKVALPFSVEFYGKEYKEAFVNANGYLTFEKGAEDHGHFPLPTPMMPGNLVTPFAMDLNLARGGNVYVHSAGNEFVVQYDKVKDFAGLGEYTFQISLNRNGVIHFHYDKMDGPTNRATTGIQNASADVGLLVAYNNAQIQSNMSVRISTSPKWLHTSKIAGSLEGGKSESVQLTLKSGGIAAGKYEAQMEITSNDPARAKITIPVSLAIEATRTLSVTPANVDFGEVKVGTSGKVALKLSNTGNAPISLSQLAISSDAFNANFQKIELEPGQSELVDLKFHPEEGKEYKGTATISSNARQSSLELRLRGQGLATPKLRINPESVRITVEAGQKASERAVLDNLEGLAKGTFELKEIRAEGTGKSKARFDEKGELAGESVPEDPFAAKHAPNQLIVSFKTGKTSFENVGKLGGGFSIERPLGMARKPGNAGKALSSLSLVLVKVDQNASLRDLANRLSKDPAVDYVEPNYILRHTETPNDPNWKDQWALPKIEATKAWQITKGAATVVVAVIDTGIDYNHPDLQGNIWKNPGEIANNGKDDDGNGFIDDVYGWDFCNKDNDPMDGNRHGTHVAGTIAAATNNGKQVAGVAWQAKLVGVKFLSDRGSGSTADAIDSIAYCAAMNFPISNNSWGGGGYSKALKEVIGKAGDKGHLFCAAAGNSGTNNDQRPHYPSNYDCPSIISVAASDSSDKLAYFSCYGKTTVDLAAPGVNILNLVPNGGTARLSGTSMATPHVAGAAALVLSQNPSAGHQELKKILIDTVDPIDAFAGKMVAGGRLNLFKAVEVSGSTWLSVSPKQGTVEAGKSVNLGFAVDATKLTAGTKKAIVAYKTNDPLAQTIEVSVNLTVTGTPKIEVDEDAIAFGEVWVGKEAKRALVIRNVGTDVLKISALKFGHAAFSSKTGALSVNPGTEETLEILGKPSASEQISTSLEIASNDPNKAKVSVKLEMQAVQPPSLSFQPDLVALTLEPGKKGEETITIANSGEAMGVWKAQLVETNKKRTRSRDMAGILSGLNAEGRAPDFYDPGLPTIGANLQKFDENSSYAIREDGGNPDAMEIAVLGADSSYYLKDVREGLVETKRFSGVTSINVRNLTPTLKELKSFDAVIVYNNYRYYDNKKLGDILADFADLGGGVVTMVFETSLYLGTNQPLRGKWLDQEYGVFKPVRPDSRNWSGIGRVDGKSHPIMKDVNSFEGSYRLQHKEILKGCSVAAKWKDGLPLVTYRDDIANVVGLNFFPVSNRVSLSHKGWDHKTDGWILMANALEWTAGGGSPDWISGTPLEGTVEGGKEGSMALKFNATGLDEGNYTAEVQFSSNDPENAYHAVKVILTVRDNQPPVALPATVTVQEDASVAFTLKGEDADGDKLTYEVVGRPKNGALAGETRELTYTPKANFNGDDELTFKVSDGRNESAVARITFKVEAVNDAPWAQSQEVNATEDEFITIAFKYGDPDGDKLELILTQEPNHGFLWEESGEWLYIPNNHFNGRDLIKYKVSDGKLTSKEATITLNLDPANDAPVASDIKVVTDENMAVNVELNATDVDGDRLTYAISTEPKHGTLTSAGNNRWTYQPFNRYAGGDAFTYRAFDGKAQGNLATVSIEVKKVNNPPVVQASTFSLEEDGKLPIKLIASDPDGDDLTFTITRNPNNGSLSGNGPSYVYTPSKDFNGQDSFQVMANDGKLESNATTITLNVEGKNDAPRFESLVGTLQTSYRETPIFVPLRATDVDGQELVFNMSAKPANGECVIRDNELIYYPAIGFTGQDEMEVEVSDGQLSDKKTLILSVAEHPNAIPIHLEESDSSELVTAFQNLIYEMNDRLVKSEDFLLKLETTASDSNSLTDPDEEAVRKIEIKLSDESVETSELTMESWIASLKDIQGTERFAFHPTSAEQAEKWMIASLLDSESSADTDVIIEDTYNNEDLDSSTTEDTPESDPSQADADENEKDKTSEGSTGVEEDFAEASLEDTSIEESPKTEEGAAQEDKQSKTEKETAVVIPPVTTDEETSSSNNADEQEEEIASGKE